jgi:hypothetical protein
MNRVRGVCAIRLGWWSVLPCPPIGPTTGATRANALTDAPLAILHGLFRSISPGEGSHSGSRTQSKLHSQGVRHAVRGSSNQVLQRTAAGAGVPLSIGSAAA